MLSNCSVTLFLSAVSNTTYITVEKKKSILTVHVFQYLHFFKMRTMK